MNAELQKEFDKFDAHRKHLEYNERNAIEVRLLRSLVSELQKENEELTPSAEAVRYMISVWNEVSGKTWREKPDHVRQMFIKAEQALKQK